MQDENPYASVDLNEHARQARPQAVARGFLVFVCQYALACAAGTVIVLALALVGLVFAALL